MVESRAELRGHGSGALTYETLPRRSGAVGKEEDERCRTRRKRGGGGEVGRGKIVR